MKRGTCMCLNDYKGPFSTRVVVTTVSASYKFVHLFYEVFCICVGYLTIKNV